MTGINLAQSWHEDRQENSSNPRKKCLCVYSQVAHLTRVLRQLIEKREISLKLVLAKLNTLMKENEVRLVFPQHIYKKKKVNIDERPNCKLKSTEPRSKYWLKPHIKFCELTYKLDWSWQFLFIIPLLRRPTRKADPENLKEIQPLLLGESQTNEGTLSSQDG